MASKEQELEEATARRWSMPYLESVKNHYIDLAKALEIIVNEADKWDGAAAFVAKGLMTSMGTYFLNVQEAIAGVERSIKAANQALDRADPRIHSLPDNSLPPWVQGAARDVANGASHIEKIEFAGMTFEPAKAVAEISALLGHQREDAASAALEQLRSDVDVHQSVLADMTDNVRLIPQPEAPDASEWDGASTSTGQQQPWYPTITAPAGIGSGGSGPGAPPGFGNEWMPGGGTVKSTPGSIDASLDPNDPTRNPGAHPVPGKPIGSGGGGLVPGIGGAAGAAGLAAAGRMSGAGSGGLGGAAGTAGARLGSGLSGAGGSGPGGGTGGGAAGSSAAGGAGGRGTSSVMGGGGAGGASQKEKRSGLGGLIAPKLEDDEELGPRSAAADAGGRDSQ